MKKPWKYKIAILGAGNMGAAFARAFVRSGLIAPSKLLIVDRDRQKIRRLSKQLRCESAFEVDSRVTACEFVVLATKPQDFSTLAEELRKLILPAQTLISIMAGMNAAAVRRHLNGHGRIICCMPNLPVQVGRGVLVYYSDSHVPVAARHFAERLFSTCGLSIRARSARLVDAATAVSASGCGFVFFLMEQMAAGSVKLGFTRSEAELIATQTFQGALDLLRQSDLPAAEWRARVTSKGGTTAAGLAEFERGKLGETLQRGLRRAYQRCAELRRK